MVAAIDLRSDYSADGLRKLAKTSQDAKQTHRLLALASIYEGGSRTAVARAVKDGPKLYLDGVVRWRLGDLSAWLHETFGGSVSETTVSRALKRLGFRVLTARPQA